MSYVALARKLRPQNFDQIVAQDFVVTTLKNAMEMDRTVHAYLFTGPRGVGKTSAARIFAKAINCTSPEGVNPCNKCESCVEITEGTSMDISEIDGASNRGIDEIRDLREAVKFIPVKSKKKIYIIDEVHMLTEHAFNALLKTLEEPPEHAMFILATTDPQRIPATIISRCQKYDFKKIPFEHMRKALVSALSSENIEYDEDALNLIIRNSDGCMRDSLSLLDQIIAYTGGRVDVDNTAYLLGYSERTMLDALFSAVLSENPQKVQSALDDISASGISLKFVTETMIEHCRNLLFYIVSDGKGTNTFTTAEIDFYNKMRGTASEQKLYALFQVFQKLLNDLKFFSFEQYVFEFGMYKAANISSVVPVNGTPANNTAPSKPQKPAGAPVETENPQRPAAAVKPAAPKDEDEEDFFINLRRELEEAGRMIIASNLEHGYIADMSGDILNIGFSAEKKFHYNMVNKPENYKIFKDFVVGKYPKFNGIKLSLENSAEKKSVAEKKHEAESFHTRKMRKMADEDELIHKITSEMNGKVTDVRIHPPKKTTSEQ